MKPTLFTAAIALLLSCAPAFAQHTVNLEWDKNPETDIAGYRVYQKITTPAVPPSTTPTVTWKLLGGTTPAVTKYSAVNLPAGTHTFAVTAFNAGMESERSNEVAATLLSAPKGLKVTTVVVTP